MKSRLLKRQFEDYILTDLLPNERGELYTHSGIYNYLLSEKKVGEISKNLKHIDKMSGKLPNREFHAVPLKFKIKNKDSFRVISLLNPLNVFESYYFMSIYGDEIINYIKNNNLYGVRQPYKITDFIYQSSKGGLAYYTTREEKYELLRNIEGSCNFYNHKPYKYLTTFLESDVFSDSLERFSNCLHFDIENFFGSIYSHSVTWFMTKKTFQSKDLSQTSSLFQSIDTFIQNINNSKTNGLVIGPEISRLISEFLMVNIEKKIYRNLHSQNLKFGRDYNLFRFLDDYYLFTDNKIVETNILNTISSQLAEFHLKIKDSKTEQFSKANNEWLEYIRFNIINNLSELFYLGEETPNKSDYGLAKRKLKTIKNNLSIALQKFPEKKHKIISYILTTILRKVKNCKYILINDREVINLVFLILAKSPSYESIKKGCYIFDRISNISKNLKDRNFVLFEEIFEKYSKQIITEYPSDWINLLLFMGEKKVSISVGMEERIYELIMKTNDPRLVAYLLIYYEATFTHFRNKRINSIIKRICREVAKINSNNFFMDDRSWWIYIFASYEERPKFTNTTNKLIREILSKLIDNKLDEVKANLTYENKINMNTLRKDIKYITTMYFKNKNGILLWDIIEQNKEGRELFYTNKKTIFFPDDKSEFFDIS